VVRQPDTVRRVEANVTATARSTRADVIGLDPQTDIATSATPSRLVRIHDARGQSVNVQPAMSRRRSVVDAAPAQMIANDGGKTVAQANATLPSAWRGDRNAPDKSTNG
jgi:hypothetical protein